MTIAVLVGLMFIVATVGAYRTGYFMGHADECLSRAGKLAGTVRRSER